jgi:hypothetical protein
MTVNNKVKTERSSGRSGAAAGAKKSAPAPKKTGKPESSKTSHAAPTEKDDFSSKKARTGPSLSVPANNRYVSAVAQHVHTQLMEIAKFAGDKLVQAKQAVAGGKLSKEDGDMLGNISSFLDAFVSKHDGSDKK